MEAGEPDQPDARHYWQSEFARRSTALTFSTGKERGDLLDSMQHVIQRDFLACETLPRIRRFADQYYRRSPAELRQRLYTGGKADAVLNSTLEVFYMCLGDPADPAADPWDYYEHPEYSWPPTQADYDRRAAEWLRQVILKRDVEKLDHLKTALKLIPAEVELFIGIHPQVVAVPLPESEFTLARPIYEEFQSWVRTQKKLPPKGKLRDAVEKVHNKGEKMADSLWSKTLKQLGLRGLPRSRKTC